MEHAEYPFIPKSSSKQYFLSSFCFSILVITYVIPPPSGISGNVSTEYVERVLWKETGT